MVINSNSPDSGSFNLFWVVNNLNGNQLGYNYWSVTILPDPDFDCSQIVLVDGIFKESLSFAAADYQGQNYVLLGDYWNTFVTPNKYFLYKTSADSTVTYE